MAYVKCISSYDFHSIALTWYRAIYVGYMHYGLCVFRWLNYCFILGRNFENMYKNCINNAYNSLCLVWRFKQFWICFSDLLLFFILNWWYDICISFPTLRLVISLMVRTNFWFWSYFENFKIKSYDIVTCICYSFHPFFSKSFRDLLQRLM